VYLGSSIPVPRHICTWSCALNREAWSLEKSGLSKNPDYPMSAYPEYTACKKIHNTNKIKKILA